MKNILILGNGLAGVTCAVKLCEKYCNNIKIKLIGLELGGLCKDGFASETNDYYQKYGPHIFHTNNKKVWDFVNEFELFIPYFHKVKANINGKFFDFPINKNTLKQLGIKFDFFKKFKDYNNANNFLRFNLGNELTDLFFKVYNEKHWGMSLSEIPSEVVNRVRVRNNYFDSYFLDTYQGMPFSGYSNMFYNMISQCEFENENFRHIDNVIIDKERFEKLLKEDNYDEVICTIRPDKLFFGKEFLHYVKTNIIFNYDSNELNKFFPYNDSAVTNFPYNFDFTRITKFSNFGENFKSRYFCVEYPNSKGTYNTIETHPIYWKDEENLNKIYKKVREIEKQYKIKIHLTGRFGSHKYLNMDQVIEQSFELCERI